MLTPCVILPAHELSPLRAWSFECPRGRSSRRVPRGQSNGVRANGRAAVGSARGGDARRAGLLRKALGRRDRSLHTRRVAGALAGAPPLLGARLRKARLARQSARVVHQDHERRAAGRCRAADADAEKELEAIEPRVPYVSVVVQGGGPKPVTVAMDGVQVPAALIGVPRPIDPGEHRFEAVSEGMDSAVSSIAVREGRSETVMLTLHPAAGGA